MVLKEIYLAYSIRCLIKEQDLCLETWSQPQLMYTEKNFRSGYMVLRQRMYLSFCKIFDPYTLQKIKIEIFLEKNFASKFHLIHTHFTIFWNIHVYIKISPWVRVELMPWSLSRLQCLDGIQWSNSVVVGLNLTQANFKESFGAEYHITKVLSIYRSIYLDR